MRKFNKRGLKCSICGRTFNEHFVDHLCAECFEIASIDNEVNDHGPEAQIDGINQLLGQFLKQIAAKGGDIAAVKSFNDYIDWTQVPSIATATRRGGDTRATNGVKAPVTVRIVDGDMTSEQYFRSVLQAFQLLGLPVKQHQKFRVQLKKAGKLIFTHRGTEYHFTAAGF